MLQHFARNGSTNSRGCHVTKTMGKCTICNIGIVGGLSHIERHASRDCRLKKWSVAKNTPKMKTFLENAVKSCPTADMAKNCWTQLAVFHCESHLLSYEKWHNRLASCKKNGFEPAKTSADCNLCDWAREFKSNLEILQQFLLLNRNWWKYRLFSVHKFGNNCKNFWWKMRDRFLSLQALTESTWQGICDKIVEVLNVNNIPLKNMIRFTVDNCSVMMGVLNGVQAKLKLVVPNLFVTGCICNVLNLVACAAYTCLPTTIDKFIKEVNYYFCNSSRRRKEFIKFQKYFGTDIHVIFKYASTT